MSEVRLGGETAAVEHRWWVDTGTRRRGTGADARPSSIGTRLFDIGYVFEQDEAKRRLTDANLTLLRQACPAVGEWKVVRTVSGEALGDDALAALRRRVPLPEGARGVIVDAGRSARLVVTGDPPGERVLEFRLGGAPSFDCWVRGEWVREDLFDDDEHALGVAGAIVARLLGATRPEAR